MGCLPYFKFYPDDWLSDRKVRRLSPEARCLYFDLLATSWKERGIPAARDELVEVADWLGFTERRFDRLWPQIEQFWVHGREGHLVNPRQEEEREKAEEVYAKRVAAGKRGGRPKGKQA